MHTAYFSDHLYKEGVCPGEGVSTPGVSAWGSSGVSAQVRCLPGRWGWGRETPYPRGQTDTSFAGSKYQLDLPRISKIIQNLIAY